MLKISGVLMASESSSASIQKWPSSVFDSRQDNTYRVCQSITATKYMKPSRSGM